MGRQWDPEGAARLEAERRRCEAMLRRAAPPEACGDAIPAAPARGPMTTWCPREVQATEAGNFRAVRVGYAGRTGARRADAFDRMTAAAKRARGAAGFVAPFTVAQVEAGRRYAALVERVEASGVKLASLEGTGGGGSPDAREAAVLDDIRRLKRVRGRLGDAVAKAAARAGATRGPRTIRLRLLVDMVCVHDRTLSDVAHRHGWAPKGALREELRAALAGALDRMHGWV